MSRLAWHVNAWTPEAKRSVASGGADVKVLNTAADVGTLTELLAAHPRRRITYREVFEDGYPGDDVTGRVDRLCRNAQPLLRFGRHLCYETPWNEERQADDLLRSYSDDTCRAVETMRARGFEVVSVGHFSVQWPRKTGRHLFLPAIQAGDYFSLHTYSAPTPWTDWDRNVGHGIETARWVCDQTGKKTIIGEFGIDFGVLGRELSGWRTEGMTVEAYAGDLRRFMLRLPRCVERVYLYTCGTVDPRWNSFDVAGEWAIESLMREEYPVAEFILGFKELADLMRTRGLDPGEPTENEQPRVFEDQFQVTRQRTSTGLMLWVRDANCPFFVGKDRRVVSYDGTTLRVA